MKQFEHIIIGFGKGGKTLANALAIAGHKVALIEQSEKMFGGTCINVACIPSKSLETSARHSNAVGGSFKDRAERYREAIEEKRRLTAALRKKNYDKAVDSGVEVFVGTASFLDPHRISVQRENDESYELRGENIYINTGAHPFIPPIPGVFESKFVYTSETMMELETLPARLVIIGGGYIGLEFASYYANFGSQVTVVQDGDAFIPREDAEIAALVLESLEERGVRVLLGAEIQSISDKKNYAQVSLNIKNRRESLDTEAVLIATGRRPNIQGLHPEKAGVSLTERGAVKVDKKLRTTAPHIWAMGDVTGGLQFTYISLDDSRIVKSQLLGDGSRTTENRGAVPYSVFLDPPLSRVGLTEKEAREKGHDLKILRLPGAAVPKAQVLRQTTGALKAIVDIKTGEILGAHFFCAESHEMINLVKMVMEAGLTYRALRDGIFTHPTMSEALNDLFSPLA